MFEIPQLKDLFKSLKKTTIDDVVDRLSYFWTTGICLFFAMLTGSRMTFGTPIQCMMPAEYSGEWNDYVRQLCYITTTYDKPYDDQWSKEDADSHVLHAYYQWVPIILFLQGLSVYIPHLLWKHLQKYNAIDFEYVVNESKKLRYSVAGDRDKGIVDIVDYLKMHLSYQGATGNDGSIRFGAFNSFLHLFSKVLTIIVVIGNIVFMNYYFGMGLNSLWGLVMTYNSFTNIDWQETGIFPRVAYCNFSQPTINNDLNRTVQCVLMMNMLNEKIFVFLWMWFAVILVVSIANFVHVAGIFVPFRRHRKADYYLRPHKFCNGCDSSTGYEHVENASYDIFADTTLGPDGLQLLDFIREHAGGMVASQIACALFDNLKIRAPDSAISHDSGSLPRNNMYIINEKDFINKTGKNL